MLQSGEDTGDEALLPHIAACTSAQPEATISCSPWFQGRAIWLVAAEYDWAPIGVHTHLSPEGTPLLKKKKT